MSLTIWIDVEKCFGVHEIQIKNYSIRAQVAVRCSWLCLCAHFVAIFNQQSRIGRMGWKCRQIWWDTDRHLEARIQRERWVVGLWVRIATYHPRAAGQLPARLQGRGGSTGLAVQGCGRDGTLLLFSVLLLLL